MRKYEQIIVYYLVSIMIVTLFPIGKISGIIGNDISKVEAATYKLTETQLFMQAPIYLHNEKYDAIYEKCEDDCLSALGSVSDTEVLVASYLEGLKSGTSYIINHIASNIGIADSKFDALNKEMAGELLREYLGNADYMEGVSSEVSKQYAGITKAYDFGVEVEKASFINQMKKQNKTYTDKEIDEIFQDSALVKKILGRYQKAEDAFKMIVAIVELHQIQIEAIDELLELEDLDSALAGGLLAIRADITDNIAEYLLRTYGTDKLLEKIEKNVGTMTVGAISQSATALVQLVIYVGVEFYDCYNPSVKEIEHATLLQGYTSTAYRAVSQLDTKFLLKQAKEEDIPKYRAAYNFYTVCLKQYMEACQKLVKNKDKRLYNRLEMYADEIGTVINYNSYLNSCLANATNAIDTGKLEIKTDSVVHKTDDGKVIDETYDSTPSILARLAEIQKQYPPNQGYTWNATYKGCWQCCGFALLVFNKLFGYDLTGYIGGERYRLQDESRAVKVGQITGNNVTRANIVSMFAKAKVGDYIQANGSKYGQHSMIFVGLASNGIVVYDCNWSSTPNLVQQRTFTYDDLVACYSKPSSVSNNGISVYRALNYSSIYGDGANLFYDDSVNFVIQDGVLVKYNGWQTYVKIPDEVTAIGANAFKNNTTMMNVEIPDSVTSIGDSAFYGCTALMGIDIPDSVETIGSSVFYGCTSLAGACLPENGAFTVLSDNMFYNCSKLKKVAIPNSVTKIGTHTFYECTSLKDVDLPGKLVEIGYGSFSHTIIEKVTIPKSLERAYTAGVGPFGYCEQLKKVEFEEGITSLPGGLFAGCDGLEEIAIPNTVTEIGDSAFYGCENLKKVAIPNSVTKIGTHTFYECTSLKDVDLPGKLVEIGYWSFSHTIIEKVTIPKSLERAYTAGVGPFGYCEQLKKVEFEEGITSLPGGLFAGCDGLEEIAIPNTITEIGDSAFYGCENLKKVAIPNSVTKIGIHVFYGCTSLKDVDLPGKLVEIGYGSFSHTIIEKVTIPKSLERAYTAGVGPFGYCEQLKKVEFEEGITTLPDGLFEGCDGPEEIAIPNTITEIGDSAFYGCENLETVTIPDSVTEIGSNVFSGCTSIPEINLPNSITSMGTSTFSGCTSLKKAHIPDIRVNLPNNTFYNCSSLTEVNFPATLETIGSSAFYNCTSLTEVNLPEKVNTINKNAFSGCTNLTKVSIPASTRKIYSSVFSHCESLTDLSIAEGTTEIGSNAFEYCKVLQSVTLPDSLQTLGDYAFRYCDMLSDINIGAGLKVIPSYCFYEDPALKKIILPQQVTTVNAYAFANCTKFEDITMNRNVNTITLNAFSYPDNLTIHGINGTYPQTFAHDNAILFVPLDAPATAIKLNKTECRLARGNTMQLTAGITPADSSDQLTWTSADEDIVTVDETGLIKAVKTGNASIIVMAGGIVETCDVTVYEKVTGVSLNTSSKDMSIGETFQLTASVRPDNAADKDVIWTTSDEAVAAVDGNGLVTAKAYGTATITVTTKDSGYTQNCTIMVKPIAVTGITLNVKTATIGVGKTYQLEPVISPENASVKEVEWTSGKPDVATVENGVVTGISEGTAVIIAKTEDGSKTASCTVTVKEGANEENNDPSSGSTSEDEGNNSSEDSTNEAGSNHPSEDGSSKDESKNPSSGSIGGTSEIENNNSSGGNTSDKGENGNNNGNSPSDTGTQDNNVTQGILLSEGSTKKLSTGTYKITKSSEAAKTVTLDKPANTRKTSVTIPATVKIDGQTYQVTEIAPKAFKNNQKLKSITIGKNITKIGKEAFSGCKKLKKITVKGTVLKSVGKNAIKNIDRKATIKVPKKKLPVYKKLFSSKTGFKKSMKVKQ